MPPVQLQQPRIVGVVIDRSAAHHAERAQLRAAARLAVDAAVPQWTQSVAPSVVKFTAAAEVVTLPDREPTAMAVLVRLKLAGVATPGAVAVTV